MAFNRRASDRKNAEPTVARLIVRRLQNLMGYGYIVIIAVIALTLYYVLLSAASSVSKVVVVGVLVICLACLFWLHRYTLAALFGLVGLGVFISFYRIREQARSSDRRD